MIRQLESSSQVPRTVGLATQGAVSSVALPNATTIATKIEYSLAASNRDVLVY